MPAASIAGSGLIWPTSSGFFIKFLIVDGKVIKCGSRLFSEKGDHFWHRRITSALILVCRVGAEPSVALFSLGRYLSR